MDWPIRGDNGDIIIVAQKIDNAMEATIKTLATKDDVADFASHIRKMANNLIMWMFIYSITQVAAFGFILDLLVKK